MAPNNEEWEQEKSRLEARIRELAEEAASLRKRNAALEARASTGARDLAASATRLEEAEQHLTLLIDAVTDYAIFMLDPRGHVVSWNPGAQRIKGYDRAEIVGQHFSRFYTAPDRAAGVPDRALARAAEAGKYELEGWRQRKDGTRFWANVVITAIRDEAGKLIGFAKITRDLTERRASEERMRQAQKMEAVGQLTGGVAHDFNNLLTVITGNIESLKRRLAERNEPALERLATAAQRGAERGALLVHRLLAFSRSQPLEPKPVSVNTLVSGMSDMLRRTLGETILIETVLAGGLWTTFVDTTELESALLNLAINARDAMPDGGKLTIEAANVYLDEAYGAEADIAPGQYVGIFVSDTGTGMSPEVLAKAFEPFFTTKGIGEGTGLGLSQVYGFIKQSGGHVKIYSEVGAGTTVKLYLPRHIEARERGSTNPAAQAAPQGRGETILVVEDDADVRSFTIEMLRELGYTVLEAIDGAGALRLLDAHREIVLLFTDVGLPGGMNGRQLADEALRRRGNLKVLFTSGYARNAIVHHGRLDPGVELLSKPFTYATLGVRIRRLLDAR
jgi:PAS domain S-box-containing protein